MGLLRYEGDWDPADYRAGYTSQGVEPPADDYADVKRWARIRSKARKKYGLTDDQYDRFVHGMSSFDSPEARAIETGRALGVERRDVSRGALLRDAAPLAALGALPFAAGSAALLVKRRPKAALGALAAGVATGGLMGKAEYDAEKTRRNEYNSILDRIGR